MRKSTVVALTLSLHLVAAVSTQANGQTTSSDEAKQRVEASVPFRMALAELQRMQERDGTFNSRKKVLVRNLSRYFVTYPVPTDLEELQRDEPRGEPGLENQPFVVDRRQVAGGEHAGDDGGRSAQRTPRGEIEQRCDRRAEQPLEQDDDDMLPSDRGIDDAEQVGVERVLPEGPHAKPLARRDPHRPTIVVERVEDQQREERRVTNRRQVEQT